MRTNFITMRVAVLLWLVAAAAEAQVLTPPGRAADAVAARQPTAPAFRDLTFSVNLLAGYDENATPGGFDSSEPGGPPTLTDPGYTGALDVGLAYRRGRGRRSIGFSGGAGYNAYRNLDLDSSRRASVAVSGSTELGRKTSVSLSQGISYDSTFGLNSFAPIESTQPETLQPGELATSSSLQGVLDQASWSATTSASIDQRWTNRSTTSLAYLFNRRSFIDNDTPASNTQGVNAAYGHNVTRTASLSANYFYSQGDAVGGVDLTEVRSRTTQGFTTGLQFTKRVSPRRALYFGFGAGATYVESVTGPTSDPYNYWAPAGNVNLRIDLGRTWALAGSYGRSATALDGLTAETYLSDVFGLSLGGQLSRRLELVFSGALATGQQPEVEVAASDYDTYSFATQARVLITRHLSAVAQYSYYQYTFSSATVLPPGIPGDFNRNAFRIGLALGIPLIRQRTGG